MNPYQITYTITWKQDPGQWNIPAMIRQLEQARKQAIQAKEDLIEQSLSKNEFSLANQVIAKIKEK